MGALASMTFFGLEPVGERVRGSADSQALRELHAGLEPYQPRWFESGTAALAAALDRAREERSADDGHVLIPAYCCPDVVSAVLAARLRPVLVDFEPGVPLLRLEQLEEAIGPATVAIVAVSFLGLPERLAAIRALLPSTPRPRLILDACQAHPDSLAGFEAADDIVFSFGRGKPIPALGGGLLLSPGGSRAPSPRVPSPTSAPLAWHLKAAAFNLILSARLYGLLESLPFLGVGKTRFAPLRAIEPMAAWRYGVIAANWLASRSIESRSAAVRAAAHGALLDVAAAVPGGDRVRLLRTPFLAATAGDRDRLLRALKARGLGASRMYPGLLTDLPRVASLVRAHGSVELARDFCRRLITLPSHSRVQDRHLADLGRVLATTGPARAARTPETGEAL